MLARFSEELEHLGAPTVSDALVGALAIWEPGSIGEQTYKATYFFPWKCFGEKWNLKIRVYISRVRAWGEEKVRNGKEKHTGENMKTKNKRKC